MRKYILFFISLLFLFNQKMVAAPNLTAFSITPLNTSGNVMVSNTVATNATCYITFNRALNGPNYEDINFSMTIIYKNPGGVEETLGTTQSYNQTNFVGNQLQVTLPIIIPAGKVGGTILIKYQYSCIHSGYSTEGPFNSHISFITSTSNPLEGQFRHNTNNGKIFIFFDGSWRHIHNWDIYNACFNIPGVESVMYNIGVDPPPTGVPIGAPTSLGVTGTASIVRDMSTGMIYFREFQELWLGGGVGRNYFRYITSPAVANLYKFALNKAVNMSYINFTSSPTAAGNYRDPDITMP